MPEHPLERDADALDLIQVVAEHLDANGRPHAGRQHVDACPNRRRNRHLVTRHPQRRIHIARQLRERPGLLFGPDPAQCVLDPLGRPAAVPPRRVARRPLLARVQHHHGFVHVELRGVRCRFRAARLAVHRCHFGKAHDRLVLSLQGAAGFLDRNARKRGRHHEQRAFVEWRHELGAETLKDGHRREHQRSRTGNDDHAISDDQPRDGAVQGSEHAADWVGRFRPEAAFQQQHHKGRRKRDRENGRREHGERLRVGQGREEATGLTG